MGKLTLRQGCIVCHCGRQAMLGPTSVRAAAETSATFVLGALAVTGAAADTVPLCARHSQALCDGLTTERINACLKN